MMSECQMLQLGDAIWHADLNRELSDDCDDFLSHTGSPAERAFAAGFVTLLPAIPGSHPDSGSHVFLFGDDPWILLPQFKCEKFRADFLLTPGNVTGFWRRVAIEIDGYKWHDTSPLLARRDKERERRFLRYGIITMRFAASEALKNPVACAAEAMRIAYEFNEQQYPCNEAEEELALFLKEQEWSEQQASDSQSP